MNSVAQAFPRQARDGLRDGERSRTKAWATNVDNFNMIIVKDLHKIYRNGHKEVRAVNGIGLEIKKGGDDEKRKNRICFSVLSSSFGVHGP
ncbi:MAG: hypothetical protein NTY34_07420 [Candidatus Omnitrophica bacterium]|nr:hypothetical protein [Candidatus Omnitrophota bacterium]